MAQPNIVYLNSHDTGRYVQPYGYAVPTPSIQRLAEEGIVFRQAFCAAPTCSPSRAALLTGQAAHSSGMLGLVHRNFRLKNPAEHLATTLKNAGYCTVLAGLQHVAPHDEAAGLGYERVLCPAESPAHGAELRAAQFIAHAAAETNGRPFFLDVGLSETHRVGNGGFHRDGIQADSRYVRAPALLPDTPPIRQDMANYISSAAIMDRKHGMVLDALRSAGLMENTLILCTTDHGLPYPGMKCFLTDHGTGVMMIVRGPAEFTGGKVIDAMVSQIDVFPTLCEVLGIEKPAWLQGKSLMPVIRGEEPEIHEAVFAEVNYHTCYEPLRAVRTRRWKYIRRLGDRRTPIIPNSDGGPTRRVWIEQGWKNQPLVEEELYDLMFDPNETRNLAIDASMSERAAPVLIEMRARLEKWMRETNDPLLAGPVYIKGALVNNPDDLSEKAPRTPLP